VASVSSDLSAEAIHGIIRSAIAERQRLLRSGGDAAALEANRRAIAYWQARLSQALNGARREA
jgi:hypothetical protein